MNTNIYVLNVNILYGHVVKCRLCLCLFVVKRSLTITKHIISLDDLVFVLPDLMMTIESKCTSMCLCR